MEELEQKHEELGESGKNRNIRKKWGETGTNGKKQEDARKKTERNWEDMQETGRKHEETGRKKGKLMKWEE